MCDRLLFHRRFFSNIFQENFFHQEILVFFSFRQIFLYRSFSSFRRWYFLLSVFSRRMFFQEIFVFQDILSFLLFNSRIFFFPGYSLCFSGDFTIHIFSLLQEIFFLFRIFFSEDSSPGKKNYFPGNKKRKKNLQGKKRKERITLTLRGKQSPENRK